MSTIDPSSSRQPAANAAPAPVASTAAHPAVAAGRAPEKRRRSERLASQGVHLGPSPVAAWGRAIVFKGVLPLLALVIVLLLWHGAALAHPASQ